MRISEYISEASTGVQAKSREAQAVSTSEMLQSRLPLTPEDRTRWLRMLLVSWDTLPVETQNELIADRWDDVGGPEWLPVLQKVVSGEATPEHLYGKPQREVALQRINEIDLDEGMPADLAGARSSLG